MPRIDFDALPDNGRLWVFPTNRALDEAEGQRTIEVVDDFLDGWAAHGLPLRSGRELRLGHFLLVGVDSDAEAPSGCSIDALVNRLRALGEEIGVRYIDHSLVWYREGTAVRTATRPDFRRLAESDDVSLETRVFDTSLTRISQLRRGEFEKPAGASWHARVFFRVAPHP